MRLGINLCFAVKRWLEPEAWAAFVREELHLGQVQFTFDLLDPWWPATERDLIVERIRRAAQANDLSIHSTAVGLAHYLPGGLLDPIPEARTVAVRWWQRAIDVSAALGATAVCGPVGAVSVTEASTPAAASRRYADLVDSVDALSRYAQLAGLGGFWIEPTPIAREYPSSVEDARRLLTDLTGRGAPGVGLLLDVGHTLHQPLYGADASLADWTGPLAPHIRAVHLDNTDGQGDPHWGWPHPQGQVDVAGVAADLRAAGLDDVPVFLEVYPRFEDPDDTVQALIRDSVAYCRAALATL